MKNSKIIPLSELEKSPAIPTPSVLVGGCFDIFHYGHLHFLKAAKARRGKLVVLLESDDFIRRKKMHVPYHTQQQRAELLAELDCVDQVILLPLMSSDQEYADVVRRLHPSWIVFTEGDSYLTQKIAYAEEIGAQTAVVPLLAQFSTTHVKNTATITND